MAKSNKLVMTANSKLRKVFPLTLVAFPILAITGMTILKFSSTETASSAGISSPSVSSSAIAPSEAAAVTASTRPLFTATVPNRTQPSGKSQEGMTWIPGGEFSMGAQDPPDMDQDQVGMQATEDSRPVHRVYVDGFWMDRTDVTNAQFAKFIAATHYITEAERTPKAGDFPEAPPEKPCSRRCCLLTTRSTRFA